MNDDSGPDHNPDTDLLPGANSPRASVVSDKFREFRATSLAIEHKTSVLVLLFIIGLMGALAYRATPKESFPEMAIPMIAINTIYPGVSPADVESQVTRILEEDLATISEISDLTSTSVEGYASILAEFDVGMDLDEALQQVREKVDLAKPDLPEDAEEPTIVEFNFSEMPIMQVNLSGEYGLVRLKEIAEELQDRLETIPSILRADVRGGLEREVKVDVDLAQMNYHGIAIDDVIDAIRNENVNIPGGSIDVGATKYLVRVDGEFDDPTLIEDLVITIKDGRPIYVRDVATVDFGFAERETFARMDRRATVTVDVIKRSGENIIETAELVEAEINQIRPLLPVTTEVAITGDQSYNTRIMVSSLENNIISGLILIVGVLLFFLGAGTSIFVAISIPSSMFLSFIVLQAVGTTMNMIVLFSLILALGMLVDNAIVVVENIYRYLEEGWDRKAAAKKATGEVALPIIAATATTLAAFAPLLFWPGEVGEFMGYLPQTLIVTLTSSLFVALVIVPTLCAMFMELNSTERVPLRPAARWALIGTATLVLFLVAGINLLTAGLLASTFFTLWILHHFILRRAARRFQESVLPWIIDVYEGNLRWALEHRATVIAGTLAGFVGAAGIFSTFGKGLEYFPESMPPGQMTVQVKTPVGTRASVTDSVVQRVEQELMTIGGRQDWESVVANTGSGGGGGNPMDRGSGGPSGPESGRVSISMVDFQDRERDAFETLAEMQEKIGREIAGAEVTVDKITEGPPQGTPVSIEIVGDVPETLEVLSEEAVDILESSPVYLKLVGLESDIEDARPELAVRVDREKAALYDLNTSKVGTAIRGAINGIEAAKYRTGNEEFDIVVRLSLIHI